MMGLGLMIALGLIVFVCLAYAVRQAQPVAGERFAHDFALLKAEQDALDADIGAGDVTQAAAQRARNELRRRVLALNRLAGDAPKLRDQPMPLALAGTALVLLVFVTLYALETRGTRIEPPAPRESVDTQRGGVDAAADFGALMAQGQARFAAGNFAGAFDAYEAASALEPRRVEGWLAQGEALVAAEKGQISPAAMLTFAMAEQVSPDNPVTQYYSGLERLQQGDAAAAQAIWQALEARSRPTAPWMPQLERGLEAAAQALGEERQPEIGRPQIEAMVAGLAARLAQDPEDAQGWLMLARSYMVLGRPDEAVKALDMFARTPDASPEMRKTAADIRSRLTQ